MFFVLLASLLGYWGDALRFAAPCVYLGLPLVTFVTRMPPKYAYTISVCFLAITALTYIGKVVSGYAISVTKHSYALASYPVLVSLYCGSRQVNILLWSVRL